MWKNLLRWVLKKVIDEGQPILAKWIDSEKDTLVTALEQTDGATVAGLICDKIKEAL
jgi:hypothetical protein